MSKAKKRAATVRASDRPSQAYFVLVQKMAGDRERGWQTRVARALGVHPSYISRIDGQKVQRVRKDIIERAIGRSGMPRDFFFGEGPVPEALVAGLENYPPKRPADLLEGKYGTERDFSRVYTGALDLLEALAHGEPGDLVATSVVMANGILQSPIVQGAWAVANAASDADRVALAAQLAVHVRELFTRTVPETIGARAEARPRDVVPARRVGCEVDHPAARVRGTPPGPAAVRGPNGTASAHRFPASHSRPDGGR